MKKVFSHWKTTSVGVMAIVGGVTRLIFAIKTGNFTEEALTTSIGGILGGIGFILSADNTSTGTNPVITKETNGDGIDSGDRPPVPPIKP